MMEEQNKNKNQDGRNFADRWLSNVCDILMRIEEYERLAKNGCANLIEYVQNQEIDFALVQEKNYQLFITEIEILLNDIDEFVEHKDLIKMKIAHNIIKNKENEVGGFLEVRHNMIHNSVENVLKKEFYDIIPRMSNLRGLLVKALFKYINPSTNNKEEELS